MDDLIRRADAIELCRKWTDKAHEAKDQDGWWMADNLLRHIKEIPSADAVSEWIPCSERLPELHKEFYYCDFEFELYESDYVLVCYKHGKENEIGIGCVIYDKKCGSYEWSDVYDHAECEVDDMSIIAWMPLPKPYEEVKENE
jgi:hypothetical protein